MRTLVSTGILKEDDLTFLQVQTCLLGDEQVRTLDDVFEVRFALRINECRHIGDVDSLRST